MIKDSTDNPYDQNLKLASSDITNVYSSVPTDKLRNIINIMCERHDMNDKLKQEIVKVSKLLIEQNSFKFHDTVYVQNEGLPIGAATLSIFFSEMYLQYIEHTEIYDKLLKYQVEGYFRYMDDILIVYKENQSAKMQR